MVCLLYIIVWQYSGFQVEVEVETMDKGGNFIGYMYVEGTNVSVALVDQGLAKVHFTAERSNHYKALSAAEERAKEKKTQVSPEENQIDVIEGISGFTDKTL